MTVVPLRIRPRSVSPQWPHQLLDVDALRREGWRPKPFTSFVVKVSSRCNLACPHCYVYSGPDQTWRNQPRRMSVATAERVAQRIAEHAHTHHLTRVGVVLHGGEPLLVGPGHLASLARAFRAAMPPATTLDLSLQTNAVLLSPAILDVLHEYNIRVGVSLDGVAADHDDRRPGLGGGPTHAEVAEALSLLGRAPHRRLFAGLLCVVDLRHDPVATYEHLAGWGPPPVDLLLPHAHWSEPPPGSSDSSATPYGDWLVAAFDRWYSSARPEPSVRLFEEVMRGLFGRSSRVESIGLSPARHIVIESDGAIEQVDALKAVYDGAAHTGRHVDADSFDAVLGEPPVVARQIGAAALSPTCQQCDLRDVCGGGYYPHRFEAGAGFRNPSVYCRDLAHLITHVAGQVRHDLHVRGLLK